MKMPESLAPTARFNRDTAKSPSTPATLKVGGLPAGASLRLYVEGPGGMGVTQELTLSAKAGTLDPDTGVRLAPLQEFKSLPGGLGGLFVSHPVLGTGVQDVVLAAGERNNANFNWRSLEGVRAVSNSYRVWLNKRALEARALARRPRVSGIFALGAGIAGAILGGAAWASADASSQARESAEAAQIANDPEQLSGHRDDYSAARRNQHGFGISSAILSSMSIASVAITVSFGVNSARVKVDKEPWEPWAVRTQ